MRTEAKESQSLGISRGIFEIKFPYRGITGIENNQSGTFWERNFAGKPKFGINGPD